MQTIRKIAFVAGLLLLLQQLMQVIRAPKRKKLYVNIDNDGSVKIGTCKDCVVHEKGRPTRSRDTNGDEELDFPRDRLIGRLTEFGLHVSIEQEYVCP